MGEVDSSTILSIPPSDQNQVSDAHSHHTGLGMCWGAQTRLGKGLSSQPEMWDSQLTSKPGRAACGLCLLAPVLTTIPKRGKATWQLDPKGKVGQEGIEQLYQQRQKTGLWLLPVALPWSGVSTEQGISPATFPLAPSLPAGPWAGHSRLPATAESLQQLWVSASPPSTSPSSYSPSFLSDQSLFFLNSQRLWRASTGGSLGLEETACLQAWKTMTQVSRQLAGRRVWGGGVPS